MNLNFEFSQIRTKHTFFKTKVRGYLLGSDANADSILDYLGELEDWINALGLKYKLRLDELQEASYLQNELLDKTHGLIRFRKISKDVEAKEKFNEIEEVGEKFLVAIDQLERLVNKS
jgi:hypothetical protein